MTILIEIHKEKRSRESELSHAGFGNEYLHFLDLENDPQKDNVQTNSSRNFWEVSFGNWAWKHDSGRN